jgi:60 kDa SS-A/Ro ribonucleoprotein
MLFSKLLAKVREGAGRGHEARLTTNSAGAPAFAFSDEHRLAQLAATGTFGGTFYGDAEEELDAALALANTVDADFVGRVALFARGRGHMKDLPAVLCAVLATRQPELLEKIFDRVIDDGRMLRGFVQMVRSGRTGRRSLGSRPKRLVRRWLERRDDDALLRDSVGAAPSLADVVQMVHPKPATDARRALYGWLLGRKHEVAALPDAVRTLEAFRDGSAAGTPGDGPDAELPDVPFQLLTARPLRPAAWRAIARRGSWQMVRQSLNTFARHGVFDDATATDAVVRKLTDRASLRAARVLPYQVLTTIRNLGPGVPRAVHAALECALEKVLARVPALAGSVFLCIDVSGSMDHPITGVRKGATTVTTCRDVAALIGAAFLRSSPNAEVVPFHSTVVACRVDRREPVARIADRLSKLPNGGTNCSAPLQLLLDCGERPDAVIFVSDNESWMDPRRDATTRMLERWNKIRAVAPQARLVCIDLVPNRSCQVPERPDVLNVGGFSDAVFEIVGDFLEGSDGATWVERIARIEL